MTRSISVFQILELHRRIIDQSGGSYGLRDFGALESSLAQPDMSFAGSDLYPTVIEKAGAVAYSLCMNHPFVDGNKRVAHAAMEILLVLNGFEVHATVEEQEQLFLKLAAGELRRADFVHWLKNHIVLLSR